MAKWARGHKNIHPMARTHVSIDVRFPREDGSPAVRGFRQLRPVAHDPAEAAQLLVECGIVNVPMSKTFVAEVLDLWRTANIRSREEDAALNCYSEPVYDSDLECAVCTHGGFCRDAARELAHDIACILKMTGELPEAFEVAQRNVAAWMAANHITGGDSSQLCDRYMESLQVAA